MFVITTITVVFRVFLKISASWSEDLAQYSFIFLAFIGAAAIMEDESHIKITVLVDRLGTGLQKVFRIIGRLLMLPFLIVFTLGAYDNVKFNWVVEVSTVQWMKIGYMYLVVFISGVIMTFYVLLNLYYDIFNKKKGSALSGGAA
jgi:TRAP-type C4-dicarboxylate transport system permease small subunit